VARRKKKHGGRKISPEKPGKLIRLFEKLGYVMVRQCGSHVTLAHPDNDLPISIPVHGAGDIDPEIIQKLLKRAGISRDKYFELL
jgi:predicted RNA binding protein YcfA (HicA-like mRNA interferase family)